MRWFRRRDETLNEQLLREAGYSPEGTPEDGPDASAIEPGSNEPSEPSPRPDAPDEAQEEVEVPNALPGLLGRSVPPSKAWLAGPEIEVVGVTDEPDLKGDSYTFVALQDGSLIVDDSCDEDLSHLADAVEEHVKPTYRATAARTDGDLWTLAARHLDLVEMTSDGELLELTSVAGAQTYAVDGRDTDPARAPAALVAAGEAESLDYDVRAVRIDGDLWDVTVLPM